METRWHQSPRVAAPKYDGRADRRWRPDDDRAEAAPDTWSPLRSGSRSVRVETAASGFLEACLESPAAVQTSRD